MTARAKNPKVDTYLRKAKSWREEMEKLRGILLGCQLTEKLKWGKPCYSFQSGNVVIIQPFKQSKTRASRVEKWSPQILKGKGLLDR